MSRPLEPFGIRTYSSDALSESGLSVQVRPPRGPATGATEDRDEVGAQVSIGIAR
jgi:hypothetical protein